MRSIKLASAVAVLAVLLPAGGCGGKAGYPSVSSLSRRWLEIKTMLAGPKPGPGGADPAGQLDDFNAALELFFASPAGGLYQVHRPDIAEPAAFIGGNIERLKEAFRAGDTAAVSALTLEIDAALVQVQSIDTGLSDLTQMRYFELFFFFSLLIIMSILALWLLNRHLEKAVSRERQSRIFSRETVLAQEQERSRLAGELHDTVAQDLWRLTFQTDSIHRAADAEERRLLCGEVARGLQDLIRRVRTICDTLIPPDFRRRGLSDALRSLCYDFGQRTGIACALTVQENLRIDPLDADRQLQCFRVVQECLANIEKHAGAREAAVLVSNGAPGDRILLICVSDDGRGFAAPEGDERLALRAKGHLGLWNMYERAAFLQGTLVLDSEEGEGTTVTLRIPLGEEDKS
ncbi:MAG: sensor histidine kinase [Treponema sp.]|nr:sensor histidine kinase [Treponema sp.]